MTCLRAEATSGTLVSHSKSCSIFMMPFDLSLQVTSLFWDVVLTYQMGMYGAGPLCLHPLLRQINLDRVRAL